MNVLILNDASAPDLAVDDDLKLVDSRLARACGDARITSARDAFRDYEAAQGRVRGARWSDWVTHVVVSYDAFVRVGEQTLGRINADIARYALNAGKPVIYITASGARVARGVDDVDPENWTEGWRLRLDG